MVSKTLMNFCKALMICIVFASFVHAKDISVNTSMEAELKKFQGTWVMLSGEHDGKAIHEKYLKKNKITFIGDKVEIFSPHQHQEVMVAKITKIDTSKKPYEVQWIRETGPKAGTTMNAIYEFEGPNKYKVCFDPEGKEAPKKFGTTEGSKHFWHIWKRVR